MSTTTILVPMDGSRFGEFAVRAAASIARKITARIELVSVFEDSSILAGSELTAQRFKEWLEGYLDDLGTRITRHFGVPTSCAIIDGLPAERLVEYACETKADLMVMSTHGRGPVSRAWVGSVADRVVHYVDIPLILVRVEEDAELDLDRDLEFKSILVALDGSQRAELSLAWTERIAQATGATMTLLQAIEAPVPFSSPYLPHAIADTQSALKAGRDGSMRYLDEVRQRLVERGLRVKVETLLGVHPALGILRYADECHVDMIAIATHGRSGLSRLVLGSVADKVLRGSRVPTLIVRSTIARHSKGEYDRANDVTPQLDERPVLH